MEGTLVAELTVTLCFRRTVLRACIDIVQKPIIQWPTTMNEIPNKILFKSPIVMPLLARWRASRASSIPVA
jgi:hypothetical protein